MRIKTTHNTNTVKHNLFLEFCTTASTYKQVKPQLKPRIIFAKRESVCAETGNVIKKDQVCLYVPGEKKVYSMTTKKANNRVMKSAWLLRL